LAWTTNNYKMQLTEQEFGYLLKLVLH
jgi:hypothetical protein